MIAYLLIVFSIAKRGKEIYFYFCLNSLWPPNTSIPFHWSWALDLGMRRWYLKELAFGEKKKTRLSAVFESPQKYLRFKEQWKRRQHEKAALTKNRCHTGIHLNSSSTTTTSLLLVNNPLQTKQRRICWSFWVCVPLWMRFYSTSKESASLCVRCVCGGTHVRNILRYSPLKLSGT